MQDGKYARFLAEDRRLCLLRILAESPDMRANHYVLQTILGSLGHGVSRDLVRTELAWLSEQGLLETECARGEVCDVLVARLTARGEDVARGLVSVPGIKRPQAGDI